MKVLFIASNPETADRLNTEAEIVEIQRLFIEAGRDVSFVALPRVPVEDLPREISRNNADIIHISSHGNLNALEFCNSAGRKVSLSAEALLDFLPPDRLPKAIYINACHSASIARKLGAVVPAIGCNEPLTNRAARAAALAFYDLLLSGQTLSRAYTVARRLVEVCEGNSATMEIYPTEDHKSVLYNPPMIMARFDEDKTRPDEDGFVHIALAVQNAGGDITQIVFFTDDADSAAEARKSRPLESQLCMVARGTPVRGVLWSQDLWPEWGNIRLFATGITGNRVAFTIETTLCKALETYYNYRKSPPSSKILTAIQKLKRLDGSDLDGEDG